MKGDTAKATAIARVTEQIPTVDRRFLTKREIDELPNILWEGEIVERLITGTYGAGNGVLAATNRRLIFIDKRLFGILRIEDFTYDKITTIESSTGRVSGKLTVYVSGNKETIKNVYKDTCQDFAAHLRNKLNRPLEQSTAPSTMKDDTAKATAIARVTEQIPTVDRRFLAKREIDELPNILWEGEIVERLITGTYVTGNGLVNGVLVATNRRLLIVDKGLFGKLKNEDFTYDNITTIESSTGRVSGELTVYASGNRETFKNVYKDTCQDFAAHLRNKLNRPLEQSTAPSTMKDDTAKATAIARVTEQIPTVDRRFLAKREIDELPNILWEGEIVERLITGTYVTGNGLVNGVLVATNRRLLIVDKGLFGKLKNEDFTYDNITTIESSTGRVSGELTVYASGNRETFKNVYKDTCQDFAAHLRNKLNRPLEQSTAPSTMKDDTAKATAIARATERIPAADRRFLAKREIDELPNILWEGEIVERLITGTYDDGLGVLAATNRRLIFIDKGLFGKLRIEDFTYDKITTIESSTGIIAGKLTVYASGNKETIENVYKFTCQDFAAHLRNKLNRPSEQATAPSTVAVSVADELGKLAALRDSGVLTQEEFDQQKQRLLS